MEKNKEKYSIIIVTTFNHYTLPPAGQDGLQCEQSLLQTDLQSHDPQTTAGRSVSQGETDPFDTHTC